MRSEMDIDHFCAHEGSMFHEYDCDERLWIIEPTTHVHSPQS